MKRGVKGIKSRVRDTSIQRGLKYRGRSEGKHSNSERGGKGIDVGKRG